MSESSERAKTAMEIGAMAAQLSAANQDCVLSAIRALLFSQCANSTNPPDPDARTERDGGTGAEK